MRKNLHADQRLKQNHKEENLSALSQEQFLLGRELGLMLNQGNIPYEVSKKVMYLLRHSQHVYRKEDGAVQFWRIKKIFRHISCSALIGLIASGKHAWQEEEETRKNSSTALILQEQLCISELFKDVQDAISLISYVTGQCDYSEQLLPVHIVSDVQSICILS